jgi:hypothetical protein
VLRNQTWTKILPTDSDNEILLPFSGPSVIDPLLVDWAFVVDSLVRLQIYCSPSFFLLLTLPLVVLSKCPPLFVPSTTHHRPRRCRRCTPLRPKLPLTLPKVEKSSWATWRQKLLNAANSRDLLTLIDPCEKVLALHHITHITYI